MSSLYTALHGSRSQVAPSSAKLYTAMLNYINQKLEEAGAIAWKQKNEVEAQIGALQRVEKYLCVEFAYIAQQLPNGQNKPTWQTPKDPLKLRMKNELDLNYDDLIAPRSGAIGRQNAIVKLRNRFLDNRQMITVQLPEMEKDVLRLASAFDDLREVTTIAVIAADWCLGAHETDPQWKEDTARG